MPQKENLQTVTAKIKKNIGNGTFVIGIEGGSGSGKSFIADRIAKELACPVIHADDFFLPPKLRTAERLAEPGGNIHYERLNAEVAESIRKNRDIVYRIFNCQTVDYTDTICLGKPNILVIEGSYCMHPLIRDIYSYKIFIRAEQSVRLQRLRERVGEERFLMFINKWIPLENRYFSFYNIEDICDNIIENN